ncbi:transglutaminase domain-containing protein [Anaeromyxobacter oryzisoli]|uniref:transglutaminase domain-containing protein n=1 Tax=Anaeromyxobacter oryzisoli TaxID=2925408 RepID=UPI001F59B87C|nr:transglutaminase domain-containing protein [Anaeromyxobacter sp. SG63]
MPSPDGFPAELAIAAQGARYVRDPRAAVPDRPPPLDVRVAGPADPGAARRFCGIALDPPPPAAPPGVPAPEAPGGSCREKAAAWVVAAASRGLEARTAVGVAHDGRGFVWHAWAEVRAGGAWIPVDPAFGEAPAHGPRFTVARFRPGDGAARDAAGRRILACWGRAHVE